jgi:hypothetical protein
MQPKYQVLRLIIKPPLIPKTMKKSIFSLTIFLLIIFVLPDANAESRNSLNTGWLTEFLSKTQSSTSSNRQKKKKLKKVVRKAGKIYRIVKPDKENRHKSRKVQRTTRRIINIF